MDKTISKIKCPYCGYWQEPTPPVVLCVNCYADLTNIIEEYSKKDTPAERETQAERYHPKSTWAFTNKKLKGTGWNLSATGKLFKKSFESVFKKFFAIYPLSFISFSSFMFVGLFTSQLGAHIVFQDVPAADGSSIYMSLTGILVSVLISFYCLAAFMIAVSTEGCTIGDALSNALSKFGSYILLFVLMAMTVGVGFSLFLLPGVIAGVFLVFTPFVFATEDVGVIEAFSKSFSYVRSSWLQIFFRLAPVALAVILITVFFAYAGSVILWATQNILAFIFIISLIVSIPIMFLTVFIFEMFEDVVRVRGILPASPNKVMLHQEEAPSTTTAAPAGFPSLEVLLGRAWSLYRKRFLPLTLLNVISYLPHMIHFIILVAGYFVFKNLFGILRIEGDYGLFALFVLPVEILVIFIAFISLYCFLYAISAVYGFVLYITLELAYVYALADEAMTASGALSMAWRRIKQYSFRKSFYRDLIVATGYMVFFPGFTFLVWHAFLPNVMALEAEGQTPLVSILKSRELVRGYWGSVFVQLTSLKVLPFAVVTIFILFIYAGLPFYWIPGLFLSFFTGWQLPGMLTIYSKFFWGILCLAFPLILGLFYLPLQKAFLYILYVELNRLKGNASGDVV
jgi:hypothetical protein